MKKISILSILALLALCSGVSCDDGSSSGPVYGPSTPLNQESKSRMKEFIQQLKDIDWSKRRLAARTLGDIGSREAIPDLIKLLHDKNWDVREAATYALVKLSAKESIPELVKLLKDKSVTERCLSTDMLYKIDSKFVRGLAAMTLVELEAKEHISQKDITDIQSILSLEWYTDDLKKRVQKTLEIMNSSTQNGVRH